jgi:hypothetical protein
LQFLAKISRFSGLLPRILVAAVPMSMGGEVERARVWSRKDGMGGALACLIVRVLQEWQFFGLMASLPSMCAGI